MKKFCLVSILGLLIVFSSAHTLYAADISIEPSVTEIKCNKTFEINVYINDINDLYGASVDFIFDPAVVKVLSEGDTPSLFDNTRLLEPYFISEKIKQNNSGSYSYQKCLTGEKNGVNVNSRTLLCSIPLKAVGKGNVPIKAAVYNDKLTNLNLADNTFLIHLADSSAEPIEYSCSYNSSVSVQTTTTSPGSGSGGSGRTAGISERRTVSSEGGKITQNDITIEIPPDALTDDVKVTTSKILDTENLPQNESLASVVVDIIKNKTGDFKKPVTITLSFNRSPIDLDKYTLSIYWLDEENNKWIELDNVDIDLVDNTVSGEVIHFTKFAVLVTEKQSDIPEKVSVFTDIKGHWAEDIVNNLHTKNLIRGYPDKTFKPDNSITRAEFASILVKALNLEYKDNIIFKDTAAHWAGQDICVARDEGIICGYNTNYFGPDDCITREQMAVMIARALNMQKPADEVLFKDDNQISAWAKDAVYKAVEHDCIKGYPDKNFKPQNNATRAEAAAVIGKVITI